MFRGRLGQEFGQSGLFLSVGCQFGLGLGQTVLDFGQALDQEGIGGPGLGQICRSSGLSRCLGNSDWG